MKRGEGCQEETQTTMSMSKKMKGQTLKMRSPEKKLKQKILRTQDLSHSTVLNSVSGFLGNKYWMMTARVIWGLVGICATQT